MNRHMTICLFALALALLAACSKASHENTQTESNKVVAETSGPSIDFVKSQPSRAQGLTLGQALDNNPDCTTHQWSVAKDQYGRDVVTFRCGVKTSAERLARSRQEAITSLQRIATMQSGFCSLDATEFIRGRTQSLNAYYDRFESMTEVLEFVVNQGQIVESRAGLNDRVGDPLALNSLGITLIASDLQDSGDGEAELDRLYRLIASGSPSSETNCNELRQVQASAGPASGAPTQATAESGAASNPLDAKTESSRQ